MATPNSGLLPFGTMYLTGARTPVLDAAAQYNMTHADTHDMKIPLGILVQPLTVRYLDDGADFYEYCGIDNGCFTEIGQQRYNEAKYLALIEQGLETFGDGLLFATAQDVAFDWEGTLRKSLPVLPKIRAAGAPAALVLQDGATIENVPWDELDAVFIGGSTEWKVSEMAKAISFEAKRRRKWVHMGRVNSMKRMRIAQSFRCDSADGTYLLHMGNSGKIQEGVANVINWCREMWKNDPSRELSKGYTYNPSPATRKKAGRLVGIDPEELAAWTMVVAGTPQADEYLHGDLEPTCDNCGRPIKNVFVTASGYKLGGDCLATLTGDDSTRQWTISAAMKSAGAECIHFDAGSGRILAWISGGKKTYLFDDPTFARVVPALRKQRAEQYCQKARALADALGVPVTGCGSMTANMATLRRKKARRNAGDATVLTVLNSFPLILRRNDMKPFPAKGGQLDRRDLTEVRMYAARRAQQDPESHVYAPQALNNLKLASDFLERHGGKPGVFSLGRDRVALRADVSDPEIISELNELRRAEGTGYAVKANGSRARRNASSKTVLDFLGGSTKGVYRSYEPLTDEPEEFPFSRFTPVEKYEMGRVEREPNKHVLISDYLIFSDYSGSAAERSNVRMFFEEHGETPGVYRVYGGHGTDGVAIRLDVADPSIIEVLEGLEEYGVMNLDNMYEVENELAEEAAESYGYDEFIRGLEREQGITILDTKTSPKVQEFFWKLAHQMPEPYLIESGGVVSFRIMDMVHAAENYALEDQGIEYESDED